MALRAQVPEGIAGLSRPLPACAFRGKAVFPAQVHCIGISFLDADPPATCPPCEIGNSEAGGSADMGENLRPKFKILDLTPMFVILYV
jgi:hypothetical protein